MARQPLIVQSVRRKRIGLTLTIWLQLCAVASWFLLALGAIHSLHTYRPRIRSYILDFYAKRDYVKRLVYASDETYIEQSQLQLILRPKVEMVQGIGNCLGALDGTHIKIRVPTIDKPKYRTRKGDIATNMLGVCTPGCYYLVDAGYSNCEGFLAPFRGQRYHLNKWRQGYQPSTSEEFFNMKHASAGNVIERCFGLLKLRWGILRSLSFYPVRVHNRIIIACCLLHNFIRTYMSLDPIEAELGEGLPSNVIDDDEPNIVNIYPSDVWATWRMELANQMFDEWQASRN
ncbi:hypothetical protein CXB51_003043 [Gossypium anomalum]|uniref:DDE Tnp4 domain-containing protein n=1 Tax=Gossypium anomalum TaxID=47600 RepID=A0A8J6D9W7_9ROSI|nr:hypothetical protein CXB51_003043 [Gossypium anomalum]